MTGHAFRRRCAATFALSLFACGGGIAEPPFEPPATDAPASGGGGAPGATCDATRVRDLPVATRDLEGYPPYAVAGCSLAYVSAEGDLVLRDIAAERGVVIEGRAASPRRPSVSSRGIVAWEATIDGRRSVRVRSGERTLTVAGAFTAAGEPRARETFVAFTAWSGTAETDDSDVWLYDDRTGEAKLVLGGRAQQRFPDVSATHVVAADFSEDPDGRYDGAGDLADIVVYDIARSETTRRFAPGKQGFPMLGDGGVLAYLDWSLVHPEPKLEAYDLRTGVLTGDPAGDRTIARVIFRSGAPVRPAMAGDTLEWVANPNGATVLYRARADGTTPPAAVAGLEGLRVFAPAPSFAVGRGFTILATMSSPADTTPRLRDVPR